MRGWRCSGWSGAAHCVERSSYCAFAFFLSSPFVEAVDGAGSHPSVCLFVRGAVDIAIVAMRDAMGGFPGEAMASQLAVLQAVFVVGGASIFCRLVAFINQIPGSIPIVPGMIPGLILMIRELTHVCPGYIVFDSCFLV